MTCHRSWVGPTYRSVGKAAQSNRCEVVCAAEPHSGQASVSDRPILCRYVLSLEHCPNLSWASVERYGQGNWDSEGEISGGWVRRVLLGGRLVVYFWTEDVWMELIMDLYFFVSTVLSGSRWWGMFAW